MNEEAVARRERLKAMRAEAAGQAASTEQQQPAEEPVLKFRNYAVKDKKNILHEEVAPAQPPKPEEPIVEVPKFEQAPQAELLQNVAPKKPNWDLKRDLQPKLDKLERRTQKALIEMLMEQQRAELAQEGQAD